MPRWAPVLILVFVAIESATLLAGDGAFETLGFAALAVGLGGAGHRLPRAD